MQVIGTCKGVLGRSHVCTWGPWENRMCWVRGSGSWSGALSLEYGQVLPQTSQKLWEVENWICVVIHPSIEWDFGSGFWKSWWLQEIKGVTENLRSLICGPYAKNLNPSAPYFLLSMFFSTGRRKQTTPLFSFSLTSLQQQILGHLQLCL